MELVFSISLAVENLEASSGPARLTHTSPDRQSADSRRLRANTR